VIRIYGNEGVKPASPHVGGEEKRNEVLSDSLLTTNQCGTVSLVRENTVSRPVMLTAQLVLVSIRSR
jgi:hypothetical protein